ncbi:unnamed protein product, partial [Mesorhabditis spiculigera]
MSVQPSSTATGTAPIEELEYYHGLLPREDLPALLNKEGDYLLRCTQVKTGEDRRTILSMAFGSDGKIKHGHYIITQEKDPPNLFTIDKTICKPTIDELVQEYKALGIPLKKEVPNTTLLHPVNRPKWELRADAVTTGKKLGDGEFGDVLQGKLKQEALPEIDVAVKVARNDSISKEKIKEVMKEARLMRDIDHPNVVRIFGVVVEKDPLMIVMELSVRIPPDRRLMYIQDAAWGIEYLHHKKIIHRDLAARNCLLVKLPNGDQSVKISDFGLSRLGDAYAIKTSRKVPIRWLAPETVVNFTYTQKTDVWAYGILVWEVYTNGDEPYAGETNQKVKEKVLAGELLTFPSMASIEVVNLIKGHCWDKDVGRRYTMADVARKLEAMNNRQPPAVQATIRKAGSSNQGVDEALAVPLPAMMAVIPVPPAVPAATPIAAPPRKTAPTKKRHGKTTKSNEMRTADSGKRKRKH